MNKKIKEFKEIAKSELEKIARRIESETINDINAIDSISLELFTNENPYLSSKKNKIFFTYSNHYHGNSGTDMSVGELRNAHVNYEDRGYIKGVATDLEGYLKIKGLLCNDYYYYDCLYLRTPKFNKSINSASYNKMIDDIVASFKGEVKKLNDNRLSKVEAALKEKTNLSLKFYIKNL